MGARAARGARTLQKGENQGPMDRHHAGKDTQQGRDPRNGQGVKDPEDGHSGAALGEQAPSRVSRGPVGWGTQQGRDGHPVGQRPGRGTPSRPGTAGHGAMGGAETQGDTGDRHTGRGTCAECPEPPDGAKTPSEVFMHWDREWGTWSGDRAPTGDRVGHLLGGGNPWWDTRHLWGQEPPRGQGPPHGLQAGATSPQVPGGDRAVPGGQSSPQPVPSLPAQEVPAGRHEQGR